MLENGEINEEPSATFKCNKYTVFSMGGTVALRSVNIIFFPESYSSAATGKIPLFISQFIDNKSPNQNDQIKPRNIQLNTQLY